MRLCSDILLAELQKQVDVEWIGKKQMELSLQPPVFYYEGMSYEEDGVYVGRLGELPPPKEEVACQIVCVGGRLPADWNPGNCCVFFITSEVNLLYAFNILQKAYLRYGNWMRNVMTIGETTANLEEMLEETSRTLGRSITLINNQLEIIAQIVMGGEKKKSYQLTPAEVRVWADSHKRNTAMRKPFFFEEEGLNTYCINIYIHDVYWGMLAMGLNLDGQDAGNVVLFNFFFQNIFMKAVKKNINTGRGNMITLKSVLIDLLSCLPVSQAKLEKACRNSGESAKLWICAVLRPGGGMENLPPEYFCKQLEERFPGGRAIAFSNYITLYLPLKREKIGEDERCIYLEGGLQELRIPAGISMVFQDILKAREAFRQAVIALEMGSRMDSNKMICYFREYALAYALKNSVGELHPDALMSNGLLQLRDYDSTATDYWKTLKAYLDNEMNVSQTARELFIHRTTLQARLQKIKEYVLLDTPQDRMYLRYCIYLHELFEKL